MFVTITYKRPYLKHPYQGTGPQSNCQHCNSARDRRRMILNMSVMFAKFFHSACFDNPREEQPYIDRLTNRLH